MYNICLELYSIDADLIRYINVGWKGILDIRYVRYGNYCRISNPDEVQTITYRNIWINLSTIFTILVF